MNFISADNISKSYSERMLFQNISLGISQGEKVALVGVNGSGKTTLMKVLSGLIPPDNGSVSTRRGIKVGYLPQMPTFQENVSVWQAIFDTEDEKIRAIHNYEKAIISEDYELMQKAIEVIEATQAWDFENKIKQVLSKLGIEDVDKQVSLLSGGQKKRVALAKLLLQEADLLILDEPTNHLDLDSIEWLENFLSSQNQTLLLVTHDRYFLDRVSNVIFELEDGLIYRFNGNYSYFLEKKEERLLQAQTEVDKARNLMRKELDWIRRQPKARGTKAKYRVDAFEDIKEKAVGKVQGSGMELNVGMRRVGNKIMEMQHLYKAFGTQKILDNFSYVFKKGDRIGIVGKNGVGKSTFLDILTEKTSPDKGIVEKGETMHIGYYTQQEIKLPEEKRIIEVVQEIAEVITTGSGEQISPSQLLTHFQFPPAQQYTYVSKLSGGEKRRLQLLQVLIQNPNFLILDEPTNDLDIITLNILEEFLENFGGCLILVSHDRYFMDRLVDHLFVFEGHGIISDFPGNYTDYRFALKEKEEAEKAMEKPKFVPITPNTSAKPTDTKRKLSYKERQEYESLEKEIETLENDKQVSMERLNSGTHDHNELLKLSQKIQEIETLVELKTLRWLELAELA